MIKRNSKIAIIGGTLWGNRGAEAMLVTTIGRIFEELPTSEFFVFSYYPEKDKTLNNKNYVQILNGKPIALVLEHFFGALILKFLKRINLSIPNSHFFDAARALEEADLLLDIGGITFSDGREKFLPFNILTILPAMMLGTPVIKLAQAVGPFNHKLNHISAKYMLNRCSHIFARGERSEAHLANIEFPSEKMDMVSDIAFLYKPSYSLSDENIDRISAILDRIESSKKNNKKVIVFSPSIVVNEKLQKQGKNYSQIFIDLIKKLGESNYHFVFLPNATREESKEKHNNDLLVIGEIKESIQSSAIFLDKSSMIDYIDFDINTLSIRQLIAKSDLLLTSRYHAMISGLALSVPTIVIGWGHKYEETMSLFNLEKYVIDFSDCDQYLEELVLEILERQKSIKDILIKKNDFVRSLSEKQFSYINQLLS